MSYAVTPGTSFRVSVNRKLQHKVIQDDGSVLAAFHILGQVGGLGPDRTGPDRCQLSAGHCVCIIHSWYRCADLRQLNLNRKLKHLIEVINHFRTEEK